jgi:PAS domain S-box-containing protein
MRNALESEDALPALRENNTASQLSFRTNAYLATVANVLLEKCDKLKLIRDYEHALDNSCIISITDESGKITYVNDNFCRMTKYSREELIGANHRIINSNYHDPSYFSELWNTISKGKIWKGEFRNKAKDGSFYWVDSTIIPFVDERNKPYQYLSIRIDITDRKHIEKALLQNQIRFQQAQQIGQMGSWDLDLKTGISKWSDQAFRVYGIEPTADSISIEKWLTFIHPDDLPAVKERVDRAILTHSSVGFNHRIIRPDGTIRHIYSESRFEFEGNVPIRLSGICQDVTERQIAIENQRALEQRLQEQERQQQLRLTAVVLEAQEKERNKLGVELHDNVNQILVAVKVFLELANKKPESAQELIPLCINHIQQAVQENRKIAHELVTPNLSLETLVAQISTLYQNMLRLAGINVSLHHADFAESRLTSEQKIAVYRILQEQFTNIVKYSQATNVELTLTTSDHLFSMIVKDNGAGTNYNELDRGIGLRNIYSRITVLGGTVGVETAPGHGFCLKLSIPIR